MKPFTQVILVLGLITLVFYAFNPFESFANPAYDKEQVNRPFVASDPSATSTNIINPDYAKILSQYNQMAPEQQKAIQEQARQQRVELGLSTGGAFSPPLAPGLPTGPVGANTTAPASPTSQASTTLTADKLQGQTPSASQAQMESSIKASATTTPTPSASVTLSDLQGVVNNQKQAELINQPTIVPVPNYVTSPSFNDILQAVDSQQQKNDLQQEKKDKKRASCKHKINVKQATYKPTACPPPDPNIWIKRNEIPCWNCKV